MAPEVPIPRPQRPALSTRGMVYASLFGALTAVGAFISIPLQPVPITLHTLFLNVAGLLLGGALGALSQVVYLMLGVFGLPVFSGGKAGFGVLLGPTGGYLVGFIFGAWIIGHVSRLKKDPGIVWMVAAIAAGHIIIYALGVLQLSYIAHLGIRKALAVGVLPFLPGDAAKAVIAALIVRRAARTIRL
jgi:biotin transport system substrate-specific component